MTRFQSILFEHPDASAMPEQVAEPGFFGDLNLDQVRDALLAGRDQYDLASLFHAPLRDPAAVHFRHEVFRDLRKPNVREPIEAFAQTMRTMRGLLLRMEKAHYELHRQRLLLEAIDTYCEAVLALNERLGRAQLASRGLLGLLGYLRDYTKSEALKSLLRETQALLESLGEIRYSLHIRDLRVGVARYEGEPDYGAVVTGVFAKFTEDDGEVRLSQLAERLEMNHVEAQVLERVARIHPQPFATLAEYCERNRRWVDGTIRAFDREVQFCLAWLDYIEPLEAAGLEFCFPEVAARPGQVSADGAFGVALAAKLVPEDREVVSNDFSLSDPERIVVVTGPNQGGKTTFARMFGQLHHLASLGVPVPAATARLALPDRLFTHFEREEDVAKLRSKLEDDLVRVRDILEHTSGDSVIVLNESLSSTTLSDALFLGTKLIGRITEIAALCVYVTFVDELSRFGSSTVSMVATVAPDDPAKRTFRILRQPADGRAFAAAIAHKYGLEYDSLKERVSG